MSVVGDLQRFFAEAIFPNRLPIAIGLAVLIGVVVVLAVRGRWDRALRRHPGRTAAVGLPLLAVALALGWFVGSPLVIRSELVEADPMAGAGPEAVLLTGEFQGADEFHFGRGTVSVLEQEDGGHMLRFEDFSVLNGPDLHVYLSSSADGYTADAMDLGKLKATDGSFHYELPGGTDPDGVASVVIWCVPFGVQFAHAPLAPPA
ncbi:MAG: DM13 domain-containing protein [Chloroflexi bacterium]|nr:DM13 domain-containing protein [Chloroflexota bacterium]